MYGTCIFCNRLLGANAVMEGFPVGRRLAFDEAKGRLWVVCRGCERWNLSPLEERWEAIEACERLYRDTRKRVSTENIGLARHTEGLELVRIGAPLRPEFAAWRYGDQFGRRRKRAILYGAGAAVALGGLAVGGLVTGIVSGAVLAQTGNFVNMWVNGRTRLRVRTDDGELLRLKLPQLNGAKILRGGSADQWVIGMKVSKRDHLFRGEEAERMAGLILPQLNRSGAKADAVQEAVKEIERRGGPEVFLHQTTTQPPQKRPRSLPETVEPTLGRLPTLHRLAFEMALHEEQERRALEGELKALEAAWQEAENIAAIADSLLLPADTDAKLARLREREDPATSPD
jgi:hypothetical protein